MLGRAKGSRLDWKGYIAKVANTEAIDREQGYPAHGTRERLHRRAQHILVHMFFEMSAEPKTRNSFLIFLLDRQSDGSDFPWWGQFVIHLV